MKFLMAYSWEIRSGNVGSYYFEFGAVDPLQFHASNSDHQSLENRSLDAFPSSFCWKVEYSPLVGPFCHFLLFRR
jgi:hypothetical protein